MAATDTYPARGFGPGLPPQGAPVRLLLADETLHIEGWPEVAAVSSGEAAARRHGKGLLLEWQIPQGRCGLLLDPAAVTALAGWLPPTGVQQDASTRRWLGIALFLAVGLPLLLLALFFAYRTEIIDAVVARTPVEQERSLGERLWQAQGAQLKLIKGTAANRFIEETGARLAQARPTPYRYRFFLVDDASVNAFAMPAGYIVVHRGLIEKAASAEEVAGVLAHEIEHVEQRHALRGLVQELGLTVVWSAVTGDVVGGAAAELLKGLAGMQFSRAQEAAADAGGYERLLAARIDPHGMASFFDTLSRQKNDMPGALHLLSTHPGSAERAAAIMTRLQTAPALPALAYDWTAIRASLTKDGAAPASDSAAIKSPR